MAPPPARPRARAAWSRLPPVRKNGTYDSPRNRTSVGDEYGAGNPEVRGDSEPGVLRTGGKRAFFAVQSLIEHEFWSIFGLIGRLT